MNEAKKVLVEGIDAPYMRVVHSSLGGQERVTILFVVSLDAKEDWANDILENSRYFLSVGESSSSPITVDIIFTSCEYEYAA